MSSPSSANKSSEGKFDFAAQLRAVPCRNEMAQIVEEGHDHLILSVQLKYQGVMLILSKLLSMRKEKKYRLDGLSLELYRRIDAKTSVEGLIDVLMESRKLSFFEARGLISQYLNMLMKRGLVAVAVKKED